MTNEEVLNQFKTLQIDDFNCSLWVFKKSKSAGSKFRAYAVQTTEAVKRALRGVAKEAQAEYVEVSDYSLLGQPSENEFLHMTLEETDFVDLKGLVDRPEEENYADSVKHLNNAAGYVVRMECNGQVLYCVKKTTSTWKTKRSRELLNFVFCQQRLDIQKDPGFSLARNFDFFVLNDGLLISHKAAFESLLNFRVSYESAFNALRDEQEFKSLFTTLDPLVVYVGSHSIRLRKMVAIQKKGLYRIADFKERVKRKSEESNWGINFGADGQIIPCEHTAKVILQVLLDHRLHSEISRNTYDVPSATPVPH